MLWCEGRGFLAVPAQRIPPWPPGDVEEPPTRRVRQQPKFIRSPARPQGHRGTAREPPVFVVLMHKYSGTELIRKKLFGIC